jgi:hypothetical protein
MYNIYLCLQVNITNDYSSLHNTHNNSNNSNNNVTPEDTKKQNQTLLETVSKVSPTVILKTPSSTSSDSNTKRVLVSKSTKKNRINKTFDTEIYESVTSKDARKLDKHLLPELSNDLVAYHSYEGQRDTLPSLTDSFDLHAVNDWAHAKANEDVTMSNSSLLLSTPERIQWRRLKNDSSHIENLTSANNSDEHTHLNSQGKGPPGSHMARSVLMDSASSLSISQSTCSSTEIDSSLDLSRGVRILSER